MRGNGQKLAYSANVETVTEVIHESSEYDDDDVAESARFTGDPNDWFYILQLFAFVSISPSRNVLYVRIARAVEDSAR